MQYTQNALNLTVHKGNTNIINEVQKKRCARRYK